MADHCFGSPSEQWLELSDGSAPAALSSTDPYSPCPPSQVPGTACASVARHAILFPPSFCYSPPLCLLLIVVVAKDGMSGSFYGGRHEVYRDAHTGFGTWE